MRTYTKLIALLGVLAGLGLTAYPIVSEFYTQRHQSQVYAQYQEAIEKADSKELDAAKRAAARYNTTLASGATAAELDAMDYASLLNLEGSGIMGYIEIPAIDVRLPIYHGVGEDSLNRGAGHLPATSLPIGGKDTHAVISAHTGMAASRMFTDLEQLETGDVFHIHVLEETLTYTVEQILVVEPYQTDALKIDAEQDYVTLVTCTPYGVNSHRLLVRGRRTEQATELPTDANDRNPEIVPENAHKQSTWTVKYWEGIWDGLFIFLIAIAILLPTTLLVKALQKRKRQ